MEFTMCVFVVFSEKMATLNFNEVTNSAEVETSIKDPMFHWDSHFPERVCRLRAEEAPAGKRKSRKRRDRNNARYKTQPITFDEIKEIDEEPIDKDLMRAAHCHSLEGLGRSLPGHRSSSVSSQQNELTRSSEESTVEETTARCKSLQHRKRHEDSIEEIPEYADKFTGQCG